MEGWKRRQEILVEGRIVDLTAYNFLCAFNERVTLSTCCRRVFHPRQCFENRSKTVKKRRRRGEK